MVAPRSTDAGEPRRPGFASSALLTWGTNIASAVLALGTVLIIARELGADGRGEVALLTAIAVLTANFATLGIQEANANLAAAEPETRRALATNSVLLALLLGGLAIGILAALIAAFPAIAGDSDRTLLWITLAFVPVVIVQIFLRFLVQADYGFAVANAAALLSSALALVGTGVFAVLGSLSVASAMGVWLAAQALEAGILVAYVAWRLAGFGRPDPSLARRSLGFGMRAYPGRVMQLGNYRLDQWLLGAIAGSRELGLYSVAVAWSEALWYLPTALAAVQRPDLVRADRPEAGRQAVRIFRATALVTVVAGAAMIVLAPVLCVDVFGNEFHGSIDDLRVLVAGSLGIVALKLFGNALVAQGRPGLQSVSIAVGFVCTVVLDVLLIPPFGGLGAALASTLAYTAAGVVVGAIFVRALERHAGEFVPRTGDVRWLMRQLRTRLRRTQAPAEGAISP